MKKITYLIAASTFLPWAAQGQTPPEAVPHKLTMSDQEIDIQMRLNGIACKAVGIDDNGQACDAAKFLNSKYAQAKQPPRSEPAKAEPTPKVETPKK